MRRWSENKYHAEQRYACSADAWQRTSNYVVLFKSNFTGKNTHNSGVPRDGDMSIKVASQTATKHGRFAPGMRWCCYRGTVSPNSDIAIVFRRFIVQLLNKRQPITWIAK